MSIFFYLGKKRLKISLTVLKSVEFNFVDRFLKYAMVHKLSLVEDDISVFLV